MPNTTIHPEPKTAKVGSRVLLIVLLPVIATGFAGLVHMLGENITMRAVKADALLTARGVELSIADNRLQPADPEATVATDCRYVLQNHGGGFEVQGQPGSGAIYTAWWPVSHPLAKAA